MADRKVQVWSTLGAERVQVEMGDYQLEALISFLRTGRDDLYPDWPEHFANEIEGKSPLGTEPVNTDMPASDAVPF